MGEGEGGECKGKLAVLQVSWVKLTKEKGTSWISVHQVPNCFVLGNVLSSLRLFFPKAFALHFNGMSLCGLNPEWSLWLDTDSFYIWQDKKSKQFLNSGYILFPHKLVSEPQGSYVEAGFDLCCSVVT